MKKQLSYLPGFTISLLIAYAAKMIETVLPVHLIGASVIALFIGLVLDLGIKL